MKHSGIYYIKSIWNDINGLTTQPENTFKKVSWKAVTFSHYISIFFLSKNIQIFLAATFQDVSNTSCLKKHGHIIYTNSVAQVLWKKNLTIAKNQKCCIFSFYISLDLLMFSNLFKSHLVVEYRLRSNCKSLC